LTKPRPLIQNRVLSWVSIGNVPFVAGIALSFDHPM
jgi:hypothetical protein